MERSTQTGGRGQDVCGLGIVYDGTEPMLLFKGDQGLRKGNGRLVLLTHVLANTEVCLHEWVRGGFCFSTLSLAFGSFSQHPSEPEEETSGKLEAS